MEAKVGIEPWLTKCPDALRACLTVYWPEGSPSTEVFYLINHAFEPTLEHIADLELSVVDLLNANESGPHPAIKAIFISANRLDVTLTEASELGWRVISNKDLPEVVAVTS